MQSGVDGAPRFVPQFGVHGRGVLRLRANAEYERQAQDSG